MIIPAPLQVAVFGAIMWGVNRLLPQLEIVFVDRTALAALIAVCGVAIELVAAWGFLRKRTTVNPMTPAKTRALSLEGPYRLSRNPMYIGHLLLLTGWAVWLGNAANLVLLPAFVVTMTEFQIKPEEAALRAKFGADYDGYCRRVRRWI